ncbi:carotenoid oxygenase family protein [Streptomyces sp. NPDC002181]|uniref:carotenoid oxygenase family protein n=1 Tax=Streptomyces sp. NPDC002181 TaxID=3364635 RepID=UPI00367DE7A1
MSQLTASQLADHFDPQTNLDHLVRQGLYRGGLGNRVGTLRGALGWENLPHEVDMDDVPVRGKLPQWLSGSLLRNGVGKLDLGVDHLEHWYDGLSLLQRFTFSAGKVSYRCRFLHSPAYLAAEKDGRLHHRSLFADPGHDILRGEQTEFVAEGVNANITFTRIKEAVIALCDHPMGVEIDPVTLETRDLYDLKASQHGGPGSVAAPAHLQRDYKRGLEYSVHTCFGPNPTYDVIVTDVATGTKSVLNSIPVQGRPSIRHSFALTENYLVLLQYPLGTDPAKVEAMIAGDLPRAATWSWAEETPVKIYIVSRNDGSLVHVMETDAMYCMHNANAYEHGDTIVMDLVAYDGAEHWGDYVIARRRSGAPLSTGQLRRYTLPLKGAGKADYEVVSSQTMELPTYNVGQYNTLGYRYVYAAGQRQDLPEVAYNQVVKADTASNVSTVWFEDGCFPGEPVFVPRPGATAEDDGVLLSLVLDSRSRTSFLLVLDARELTEIARAQLDTFIPYGFHGQFMGEHYASI